MSIQRILHAKRCSVHAVHPLASVSVAVRTVAAERIGALVVRAGDHTVEGIFTEPDVVRGLAAFGPELLTRPVAEAMTRDVSYCAPDTPVAEVMALTRRRTRNLIVRDDRGICGLISI